MTLTEYTDVEQGSQRWHDLRRGLVTASVVGQLITPNTLQPASNDTTRALTALLVAERITGVTEPTYQNADMFRGQIEEPRARDHYAEQQRAEVTEAGFIVRQERNWKLGYSPDGLVGDDGLLEIKAPRAKTHIATILSDKVPTQYMPQLQAGLLVSGREWIDFVSWSPPMPMWRIRVHPDPAWQEAIVAAVTQFEETAASYISVYKNATRGLAVTERLEFEEVELKLA